jgi:hypothetical protein
LTSCFELCTCCFTYVKPVPSAVLIRWTGLPSNHPYATISCYLFAATL